MTDIKNYNIEKYESQATEILSGKNAGGIIGKAVEMFENVPVLRELVSEAGTMVNMIKDYTAGKYKRVPYATIVKMAMAVAYVVSPVDAIPDTIPVVGYVDDFAVVEFVAKSVKDDVEEYKEWKGQG